MMSIVGAVDNHSMGYSFIDLSPSERSMRERNADRGFSLVEVALALGVAGFVLIALLGLISQGVLSTKTSVEESRALNLLDCVISDRKASPLSMRSRIYDLPLLDGSVAQAVSGSFGVGDDFVSLGEDYGDSRFRVDYTIWPTTANAKGPYVVAFRASWPAAAATPESSVEQVATFLPE